MYLNWQCPNCKEKHLKLIDDIQEVHSDSFFLKCSSCLHTFKVSYISCQVELK